MNDSWKTEFSLDEEDENNITDQDLVYQELYGEVTEEDSLETGVRLKASVLYQLLKILIIN